MMAPPIVAVLCAYIAIAGAQRDAYELIVQSMQEYPLPELPYAYDGLEPFLDAATLRVHHQGHHKAYTNKMNVALKDWREHVSRTCHWVKGAGLSFAFYLARSPTHHWHKPPLLRSCGVSQRYLPDGGLGFETMVEGISTTFSTGVPCAEMLCLNQRGS